MFGCGTVLLPSALISLSIDLGVLITLTQVWISVILETALTLEGKPCLALGYMREAVTHITLHLFCATNTGNIQKAAPRDSIKDSKGLRFVRVAGKHSFARLHYVSQSLLSLKHNL